MLDDGDESDDQETKTAFFKELERQDRIRQTLKKWDVSKSGGLNKDELGSASARSLSLLCAPLMCKQSLRADLNTCDIVHAGAMLQDLAGGTAPTEEEVASLSWRPPFRCGSGTWTASRK